MHRAHGAAGAGGESHLRVRLSSFYLTTLRPISTSSHLSAGVLLPMRGMHPYGMADGLCQYALGRLRKFHSAAEAQSKLGRLTKFANGIFKRERKLTKENKAYISNNTGYVWDPLSEYKVKHKVDLSEDHPG